MNKKRIAIRGYGITIALFCLVIGTCGYQMRWIWTGQRSVQEAHFRTLLAQDPRIENISVRGYEEEFGTFTVTQVGFSIRGRPNSSILLFVPDGERNLESLSVYQIGNLSPIMMEWYPGAGAWAPRCPTLGDQSNYRPELPWATLSLLDVVSRYDELMEYFAGWPTSPDYLEMTTNSGTILRYYVEPPNVNTKDQFIPPGN